MLLVIFVCRNQVLPGLRLRLEATPNTMQVFDPDFQIKKVEPRWICTADWRVSGRKRLYRASQTIPTPLG